MDKYLEKKFPEKIKEFHNYDEAYFSKILDQATIAITKNMHPIIAYNYPNLLEKFFNETDMSNISKSPSIILHYVDNGMFKDKISKTEIEICNIIKGINNKVLSNEEIFGAVDLLFGSKRQRSTYSKSYPILHDKFENEKDNFEYNLALIAFEHKDYKYIRQNIEFVKGKFKARMIEEMDDAFDYLHKSEYDDEDLLRHINRQENVKHAKSTETILKFWNHHKSTKNTIVNSTELLNSAIEMGLTISKIDTDFLNENAELVLTHFPYWYPELNVEIAAQEHIQNLALRDPYNIYIIELTERNIKHFLNCSNINIREAYYGMYDSGKDHYRDMLLAETEKFQGMFLALQAYPLLIMLLNDDDYYKYVTPYLINHSCKIDPNLFEFFKNKEAKRWTRGE